MARRFRKQAGVRSEPATPVAPEPRPPIRIPRRVWTALLLGAAAAGAGYLIYQRQKPTTIRVQVFTDFAFRQRGDWEEVVRARFRGVNQIYQRLGVRWEIAGLEIADPTPLLPGLDNRRRRLTEASAPRADLWLALSTTGEGNRTSSIAPFSHTAIVIDALDQPEPANTARLARELAYLFGASPEERTPGTLMANPPAGDQFPARIEKLIGRMRRYDFSRGTDALEGSWADRAVQAIAEAAQGVVPDALSHAHEIVARSLLMDWRIEPAIGHLREAVKAGPKNESARISLATALMHEDRLEEAIQVLRAGLALDPRNSWFHSGLAVLLAKTQHQGDAIQEITDAIRQDPNNAQLHGAMAGLLLTEVGQIDRSIEAYETALRLEPDSVFASHGLDRARQAKEEAVQEVARYSEQVRQAPQDPGAHYALGLAEMHVGNFEAARQELEKTLQLSPADGKAHLTLAEVRYLKGDYTGAAHETEQARKAGIEPPRALLHAIQVRAGQ